MKQLISSPRQQAGVMLIEALIAILIFSIGILGIIGLQGSAVTASVDARSRSEAALLANDLIGRMWAGDRTLATLQANYASANASAADACKVASGTNGAVYEQWAWIGTGETAGTKTAPAQGTVLRTLPGATAHPPTVKVAAGSAATAVPSTEVTITICWQAPGEDSLHKYVAMAHIGG